MYLRRTLWQSSRYARSCLRSKQPSLQTVKPFRRHVATVSAADLTFGQPVYETHPHLLKAGELTPGITAQEYANRRTKLAAQLPDNAVAIVAAADIRHRSGNCFYEFYQDPDFFYLTGFNEPEALAIIGKDSIGTDHTFHLYVREKDAKAETWDGARSGTQAAQDVFNADESGDISMVQTKLPDIIKDASQIYTDITTPDTNVSSLQRFLFGNLPKTPAFAKLIDPSKLRVLHSLMNDLRIYKSPAEIANMRLAGQASGRAHTDAMRQPIFTSERALDAFLRYRFTMHGSDALAFEPVVAGGANALSIHYVRNDARLDPSHLVLVDGGGRHGGYIADITRTWPVSGKFTTPQRDLYEAVLRVQRSMISMCRGDAQVSLDKLHGMAEHAMSEQLRALGFDMSTKGAIEALFPHHLSHYIGLDVHDCIGYSRKTVLREGHCITIEPGVYVPKDERWPRHFWGIGVRIEDSVAVYEDGPLVLTTEAVKEVVDIEALRD